MLIDIIAINMNTVITELVTCRGLVNCTIQHSAEFL